jgi:DNA-binding NarL/FixJ family response regulator
MGNRTPVAEVRDAVNPLRILLVDDHELVRKGIRSLLSTRPEWQVCGEAENGKEAVELVEELAPDVVVMDVSMPVMDGLGALAAIHQTSPELPIIMMTMHDTEELTAHVVEAGAKGLLSKSEAASELLNAIDSVSRQEAYFTPDATEVILDSFIVRARADLEGARSRGGQILSLREREVVRLLSEGRSNREIAADIDISVKTVESYRASAMRKVGARSLGELVHYAIRNRIIEP